MRGVKSVVICLIVLLTFCSVSLASGRKMLGIAFSKMDANEAMILGSGSENDYVVSYVLSRSDAKKVLKRGDVIVSIDSTSFATNTAREVSNYLGSPEKDSFSFTILRDGQSHDFVISKFEMSENDVLEYGLLGGDVPMALSVLLDIERYYAIANTELSSEENNEFQDLYYGCLNSERGREAVIEFKKIFADLDIEKCGDQKCRDNYFKKARIFLKKYPDITFLELALFTQAIQSGDVKFSKYMLSRFLDKKDFHLLYRRSILDKQSVNIIRNDKRLLDRFTKRAIETNDANMLIIPIIIKFGEGKYAEAISLSQKINGQEMAEQVKKGFSFIPEILYLKYLCTVYGFDLLGYHERSMREARTLYGERAMPPELETIYMISQLKIASKSPFPNEKHSTYQKILTQASLLYATCKDDIQKEFILKMLIYIHSELGDDKMVQKLKEIENPLTKDLGYKDYPEITRIISTERLRKIEAKFKK